jgi:cytochrome c oxidase subunit 3
MNRTAGEILEEHRDYTGSKIGMWLFLFTELFLFGGLFLIYATYRYTHPQGFQLGSEGLNIILGTLNTAVLVTSSLTMALSVSSLKRGNKRLSTVCLVLTILLGAVFLLNKYFEWSAEIQHGIYPGSAGLLKHTEGEVLFYGLYYMMTGLHGLHVLAGIILLSVILVLVVREKIHRSDFIKLENSGLYWHLVDIIWIYLFPLFYLVG